MSENEDEILEARFFEYIKLEHADLFDQIEVEELTINETPKNVFLIASQNGAKITFYVLEKTISYEFQEYHSGISLFPYPEKGFDSFIDFLRELLEDKKILVSWSAGEPVAFAEIIPAGGESAYDFLWEEAEQVTLSSWSGKLDRTLK